MAGNLKQVFAYCCWVFIMIFVAKDKNFNPGYRCAASLTCNLFQQFLSVSCLAVKLKQFAVFMRHIGIVDCSIFTFLHCFPIWDFLFINFICLFITTNSVICCFRFKSFHYVCIQLNAWNIKQKKTTFYRFKNIHSVVIFVLKVFYFSIDKLYWILSFISVNKQTCLCPFVACIKRFFVSLFGKRDLLFQLFGYFFYLSW